MLNESMQYVWLALCFEGLTAFGIEIVFVKLSRVVFLSVALA